MKTIVVTGSTRGIGYGVADALLARGCRVVINGRRQNSVDAAIATLSETYPAERIFGHAANMADYAEVQALWEAAAEHFGPIDIWIHNAALGSIEVPLWEQEVETIESVVAANLNGTLFGCKVAINGMLKQGHGHVYTFEGWGSGGEVRPNANIYATTKAAIAYLTKVLMKEVEGTPVKLSTINPGMVVTDMLLLSVRGREQQAERIFNILGDKMETVAPWIADQVLANDASGQRIVWMTPLKAMRRFLMARFTQRDVFKAQDYVDQRASET